MKFLNIIYTQINAEVLNPLVTSSKINTNIDILDIEQLKMDFVPENKTILKIHFYFGLDFLDNIAKIIIKGIILMEFDSNEADEILTGWKDKKVEGKFKLTLFNIILRKCSIKALELEDELNLPPHFSFPSFEKKKKEE